MSPAPDRHIIGCMSGTSLDGLDAALIHTQGTGLNLTARLLQTATLPFPPALGTMLGSLAAGGAHPPLDYLRAARHLGQLHAHIVQTLQAASAPQPIDLVVAHGQTLWHAPGDAAGSLSWQLFDPWPLVHLCRVPTVCDLRQADLVTGGQGAPITPLADWILLRSPSASRAVVNLGGICNFTLLPAAGSPAAVGGEDLGPCNLLLDGLAQRLFNVPYDADGRLAVRGGESSIVYRLMLEHPFFSRPRPRSTGREDFTSPWIDSLLRDAGLTPHDMLASAVDAVARLIVTALTGQAEELILAGGGVLNKSLLRAIRTHARDHLTVKRASDLGIPVQFREAMEFAVLGALAQDGVPLTLPQITGGKDCPRFGTWVYP